MMRQILAPRTELSPGNLTIPFTVLTNNGGFTEEKKAEEINTILNLDKEDPIYSLDHTNIIQCHTPLREQSLVEKYKGRYVLVCGQD